MSKKSNFLPLKKGAFPVNAVRWVFPLINLCYFDCKHVHKNFQGVVCRLRSRYPIYCHRHYMHGQTDMLIWIQILYLYYDQEGVPMKFPAGCLQMFPSFGDMYKK